MHKSTHTASDVSSPMTFNVLWQRLMRQKMLITWVLLMSLLLAGLLTWMMTPSYRAVSTLQIEKEGVQVVDFGKLNTSTPDLGELDPFFRTQYEQLKSRALISKVIDDLNLESRLFTRDFRTPLRKMFDQRTGELFGPLVRWVKGLFPEDVQSATKPDRVSEFLESLYVEPVEKAHLVNVFFKSPDDKLSAEVVNALVDTFILTSMKESSRNETQAQTFLQRELEKARERLTDSEEELVNYARENNILEVNNSQVAQEQKLTELNKALVNAELRRVDAETRLKQARKHGDVSSILNNSTLAALKQQLATLEANYRKQLKTFKPAYPDMQQLAGEIAALRSKVNMETARLTRSLESTYAASANLENSLRSDLSDFQNELTDLRDRGVEYKALQREVETNSKLYDSLLKRVNEVGVAAGAGASASNVRVVDRATPPERPFRPNKLLNLLLGGVLGLMLGSAVALLRESSRKSVESVGELQAFSGLPILGTIPHVNKKSRRILSMAAVVGVGSPVAEAYRVAATNLKFAGPEGMPRSLLVTSLNPGEGKSTSSVNLALSLAQIGHKVLLIDTDLRRPTLHEKLGMDNHVGLTEYLYGDIELSKVTRRINGVKNAFVITAGMMNLDPVEALSNEKMTQLVNMASQYFDISILDAPPVTGFADALLLAEMSDATLLVSSEDDHSDKSSLATGLEQLQRVRQNVIGWLIVKARQGIVSEQYYALYSRGSTHRKRPDASLVAPVMLQKKGLNLAKDG